MKRAFSILIVIVSFQMKAQMSAVFSDEFPDSAKARLGIIAEYGLNSTVLTNHFVKKFYTGGYIDKDLKNAVLKRVRNSNRMGADINYGIYAAFKPDSFLHKKNLCIFFSLRNREHFDTRFSKDFFKISFYGNAQYAGKTANLNDFNLNLLRYQQFQVGYFSTKLDSAARWGIGLSFLKGEQYLSVLAKKAELFTSEDGQYIDFNTSLQIAQSDTAKKGLGAFNGFGASIDIYFEAPFKTKLGNSKIRASIADVGLIRFNNQSLLLNQDSVFHYTGFTINSIYDLKDSTFKNTSQDSIISAVAPFEKRAFSATLPATLNLNFETKFSNRFRLTEGIRYMFNANQSLLAYLKGDFIFSRLMLSVTFAYGGYGRFNYGLGISADLGTGFRVYAGSNNLEGFIAPKKTFGQGAYISFVKNFK